MKSFVFLFLLPRLVFFSAFLALEKGLYIRQEASCQCFQFVLWNIPFARCHKATWRLLLLSVIPPLHFHFIAVILALLILFLFLLPVFSFTDIFRLGFPIVRISDHRKISNNIQTIDGNIAPTAAHFSFSFHGVKFRAFSSFSIWQMSVCSCFVKLSVCFNNLSSTEDLIEFIPSSAICRI